MAPSWMKMSNVLAASPVSPSQWLARIRWPVDETGMNSVTPSSSPSSAALSRTSPAIDGAHLGALPQDLLVQLLVHRNDAIGGELLRLADRGFAHRRIPPGIAQQLDRAPAHRLDRAHRLEDAGDAVVHHLGDAPRAARDDRRAAGHRLERREAERLGLRGQQEEI